MHHFTCPTDSETAQSDGAVLLESSMLSHRDCKYQSPQLCLAKIRAKPAAVVTGITTSCRKARRHVQLQLCKVKRYNCISETVVAI